MSKTLSNIIIFGKRSNLSIALHNHLENSITVSREEYFNKTFDLQSYRNVENLKIIINAFYPSTSLNDFTHPKEYITDSIYLLSSILSDIKNLHMSNIDKIIYTSSAAVYGNNPKCRESDLLMPQNLYGSLKLASEKLVESFCDTLGIEYTIARIFNMYGGNDSFSIIGKMIRAVLNHTMITIANHGDAIRDFVHIDDVVAIYLKLLENTKINHINIANGRGVAIKSILEAIEGSGFSLHKEYIERKEIDTSIACIDKLSTLIDVSQFKHVDEYVKTSLANHMLLEKI